LRERGSELFVRIGQPEQVLVDLAKSVGADGLYVHQEVTSDELKVPRYKLILISGVCAS
jgi:deoxyribodipyrimidine photo-lyase